MKRTNVFHSDAGHGWLEVTLADVCTLGICQKISGYSYVDVNKGSINIKLYLEEDYDANIYLEAYKAKYGKMPKIEKMYYNNYADKIRSLPNFNGNMQCLIDLQNEYLKAS